MSLNISVPPCWLHKQQPTQQSPRAALPVNMKHSQYLEKPDTPGIKATVSRDLIKLFLRGGKLW